PLATLAEYERDTLDQLRRITHTDVDALANLWRSIDSANADTDESLRPAAAAAAAAAGRSPEPPEPPPSMSEKYYVLVECCGEAEQLSLLDRFLREGLTCRALIG